MMDNFPKTDYLSMPRRKTTMVFSDLAFTRGVLVSIYLQGILGCLFPQSLTGKLQRFVFDCIRLKWSLDLYLNELFV